MYFELINVKITLSVSHIKYSSIITHVSLGCLFLLHIFYCIPTTLGAAKWNSEFWKICYACYLHLFVIAEESVLKFVPFVEWDLSVNVTGNQFV